MPKIKKPYLVVIDWVDITDHNGWHPADKDFDTEPCKSVGWVIFRDKKQIQITETLCPVSAEDVYGLVKCLPMGCVKSIKRIG